MKNNMRKIIAAVSMTALLTMGITLSVSADEGRLGFITGIGGLGDKNLNDVAYEGMTKLEEQGVTIDVVEPEDASDFVNMQTLMADSGSYDAIICVSFDQTDALSTVSAQYPEQKFLLLDSEVEAENVTNILFRAEETGFQLGVLSGLLEKENALSMMNDEQKIGFVGGMDTPTINQFAAGYIYGAKLVNSEIEVEVSYVGNFADPAKATELTNGLYEKGCDIVFACAGGSGLGVFASAQKSEGYALGIEVNQNENAPDHIIASGMRLWDAALQSCAQQAIDGTLEPGTKTFGLSENALEIGYEGSKVEVSEEVKAQTESYCAQVAAGEITVPTTLAEVDEYLK